MQLDQEKMLVKNAKTDANSFGALYDLNYAKIFNYVLRRTGDFELAEDITTDVFMKALSKIQSFTWRGLPFSAWLYRIASHEIADHFRGKQAQTVSLELLMEQQGFEPVADTDIEAELMQAQAETARHQQFLAVQKQLKALPLKYQEALSLRYFEKKSITEISIIMNKRPGTIKSLLSRGVKKLRDSA